MNTGSECDDVRETLLFGRSLDARRARHLDACPACRDEHPVLVTLARTLAADAVPLPADAAVRLQRAAAPLLARNARRATWRSLVRVIGLALLPLPLVVALDAYLLRMAYAWLSAVLPDTLSLFLVLDYTALVALLLTLAYGAIPLLTERQLRLQREESYG